MTCSHQHSVRTSFCPSHLQMGCNGTYLALPYTKTAVGVWSLQSLTSKPLELTAHKKKVTSIRFGNGFNPTVLCTAAEDYIIVWNVEKARAVYNTGQQIRGQVIGQCLGYVQYTSFSPDDSLVAVCIDRDVLILDSKEDRLNTTLDGHTARVTCAEFSPHQAATVVSISDDRTFKIWNIGEGCLLFQSTIISASPFLSLAMDPAHDHFALGTSDGQIRVYDMMEDSDYRLLHHVDVAKIFRRKREKELEQMKAVANAGPATISSQPAWKQLVNATSNALEEDDDYLETSSEAGEAILGLFFAVKPCKKRPSSSRPKPTFLMPDESHIDELLDVAPTLLIGTPGAILHINAHSFELNTCTDFKDPVPSEQDFDTAEKYIELSGSFAFSHSPDMKQVFCLVGNLFQNHVDVLRIQCATHQDNKDKPVTSLTQDLSSKLNLNADNLAGAGDKTNISDASDDKEEETITVLSSVPLHENSLLRQELVPKAKPSSAGQKGKPGMKAAKKTSSGVQNQSLTFKTKVRSSGYTKEQPRMKLHSPQTGSSKSSPSRQTKATSAGKKSLLKEYPLDAEPPTTVKTKLSVVEQSSPVYSIRFSDDGQYLACAMADKSAQLFKMPLTGKGNSFTGHNACVNSVHWSHDNQWLITCSDDKTAKIWNKSGTDPIMTLSSIKDNFDVDKEGPKPTPNKSTASFSKEIKEARFYYMDKFVLLTCGGSLYMYKYHLDSSVNDIKRYLTNSRYKLVKNFELTKAQQISTFSAVNGFYSYIVLCAGSDKSLEVFDMNVGKSVRHVPDAHTRPVHAICQNEGSTYVSHPASAYDLFLTSAVTDGVKLWDLRTNRCVRRFEGHHNRAHSCGLAFSPCAKYFATGAEDRSAYVFDLRGGTYLHKLSGHSDVVSDVAYHPLYPEGAAINRDEAQYYLSRVFDDLLKKSTGNLVTKQQSTSVINRRSSLHH